MAGVTFNKCQIIPDAVTSEVYGDEAANYAEDAAKFCGAVTSDVAEQGRKDCGTSKTPPLFWGAVSIEALNLPAQFSFNFDVWAGVERKANAKNRIWIGIDLGKYGTICKRLDKAIEQGASIAYDTLASAIEKLVDEAASMVDEGAAVELALKALAGVVVFIALVGVAAVLSSVIGSISVSGSAAAATAGAATIVLGSLG